MQDTREPYVFDEGLRMMQVMDVATSQTLGTLVQWANHPETLWSKNLLISSDFPHYLREAVEKGGYHGDSLIRKGVGGVALYVNGAVGGLMTTHASTGVANSFCDTVHVEPSFDKIDAFSIIDYPIHYIEQPIQEMGEKAVDILVRQIDGRKNPIHLVLNAEVVFAN